MHPACAYARVSIRTNLRIQITTYGDVTAVPVQWHKHRAAYTDMPNMRSFVEVTTRTMSGDSTNSKQLALAKGTYRTKLADLCGGVVIGSSFRGAYHVPNRSPCTYRSGVRHASSTKLQAGWPTKRSTVG